MELTSLKLTNFKSYPLASLEFHRKFNCLTGLNGSGKTNVLDAIYTLCFTKSFFRQRDLFLVHDDEGFYRLEGVFLYASMIEEEQTVVVKYPRGGRKAIERNGDRYRKYSDHMGRFPVVMIAPGDDHLMITSSSERRRYLDQTLSQVDPSYLEHLLTYNRLLQQRNALLKNARDPSAIGDLLTVYDRKMEAPAMRIYEGRKALMTEWDTLVRDYYDRLSGGQEMPALVYRSQLDEASFVHLMAQLRDKDGVLKRTSAGVHKDDLQFFLKPGPLKTYGSQGQKKSFLLALKLAQYDVLNNRLKNRPILLLDDIFDKLDNERVHQLLHIIREDPFGQIFITDTDSGRLENYFLENDTGFTHFLIKPGQISINEKQHDKEEE